MKPNKYVPQRNLKQIFNFKLLLVLSEIIWPTCLFAQAPIISYNSSQTYTAGTAITTLAPTNSGGAVPAISYQEVSTFAGSGAIGSSNGTGTAASFYIPNGLAMDASGNIYVADEYNNVIRKITKSGEVSIFAGSGSRGASNGSATEASFSNPSGLAFDTKGNLYVADYYNNIIRKVDPSGNVTTFAGNGYNGLNDGIGINASFYGPRGVALDAAGNVYVADEGNNMIRKIDNNGLVTTIAGNGSYGFINANGTSAAFNGPYGIAIDPTGNLYVCDGYNNVIRKIDNSRNVTTFAGKGTPGNKDGKGTDASFYLPFGITFDPNGNLIVSDYGNNQIRKIDPTGYVSTFVGNGSPGSVNGIGTACNFNSPSGIIIDALGNIYVADSRNNLIRKINSTGYSQISPALPSGLIYDPTSGTIKGTPLHASKQTTYSISAYNLSGGSTATFSIAVLPGIPSINSFNPINAGTNGTVNILGTGFTGTTAVYFGGLNAQSFTILSDTVITATVGVGASGSVMLTTRGYAPSLTGFNYITPPNISYPATQIYSAGKAITSVAPTNKGGSIPPNPYALVNTIAGNGTDGSTNGKGTEASFSCNSVASDPFGNLFVADKKNNIIRKIDPSGNVSTFAGNGTQGASNGNGALATFNSPQGVATDANGNVYVADTYNNLIRKIDPFGNVTTIAGNGLYGSNNGVGLSASFSGPAGIATDMAGNLYVADSFNNIIRKIDIAGNVTTFAGTPSNSYYGAGSDFYYPTGIATDANGNVYVADTYNNRIRKINSSRQITTIAGNGNRDYIDSTGVLASFTSPTGLVVDAFGNIYVADAGNNTIRKIDLNGKVSTIAGYRGQGANNGTSIHANFNSPFGIAIDASGNLFVADAGNNLIRKITTTGYAAISPDIPSGLNFDTTTGTISGTPKHGSAATTYTVSGYNLAGSSTTKFSISIVPGPPAISSFIPKAAGTGNLVLILGTGFIGTSSVSFGNSSAQRFTVLSDTLITAVVGAGGNGAVSITNNGVTTTLAGFNYIIQPNISYSTVNTLVANTSIASLNSKNSGGIIPAVNYGEVTNFAGSGTSGSSNGIGNAASFSFPSSVATDANGNVYVADTYNSTIRKIDPSGTVTTIAGNGSAGSLNGNGTAASFNNPSGLAIDLNGNIYVADAGNNLIRKIDPNGNVTTLAGNGLADYVDGFATSASFNSPVGIAVDAAGNIYVADAYNNRIRKINQAGQVSTYAGSGYYTPTGYYYYFKAGNDFYYPAGVATDLDGNVYVADRDNHRIRKITPSKEIITVAGNGNIGSTNGLGIAASFKSPVGVTTDAVGNLYVADYGNQLIRKIDPTGQVTTLAGNTSIGNKNGIGKNANFNNPVSVASDLNGNLFVADEGNNVIRKINLTGYASIIPDLPSGLTFDATSGTITGKSKHGSPTTSYTVSAYNIAGFSTTTFSIAINSATPQINTFYPTTCGIGSNIAILGDGFLGTTSVSFGGAVAQSFTVVSDTVITAVVGAGSSGAVSLNTRGISSSINGFAYISSPKISYTASQTFTGGTAISPLIPTNTGGTIPVGTYSMVNTLAGNGSQGSVNGMGTAANFRGPTGTATDALGNIYVADSYNNLIRKIDPTGLVSTYAGSGEVGAANGNGTAASFNHPVAVATDINGNVYVVDNTNNLIRKIDPSGNVTTLAGNSNSGYTDAPGTLSSFNNPCGVATDALGNVYVTDTYNNVIRKIDPSGNVTTLAGNGTQGSANGNGTAASFFWPQGIASDAVGNIYVSDTHNHLIRKIDQLGNVTTLAGSGSSGLANGIGVAASFNFPIGIATDFFGNVYVADNQNNLIRKINQNGEVSTLAGSSFTGKNDGIGFAARFSTPEGLAVDATGNIYVGDLDYNLIRKVNAAGYSTISPALPTGLSFNATNGIINGTSKHSSASTNYTVTAYNLVGSSTSTFNITVLPGTPSISLISPQKAGAGSTVAILGTGLTGTSSVNFGGNSAQSFTVLSDTLVTAVVGNGASGAVSLDTRGSLPAFNGFNYIAAPNISYKAIQPLTTNRAIYPIAPSNSGGAVPATIYGKIIAFAGNGYYGYADGAGSSANFNYPQGLASDHSGNIYVADAGNNLIRKIDSNGVVSTFAGFGHPGYKDGLGSDAVFNTPASVATDLLGNVYVADELNNLIRKIDPSGNVTTFAGNGSKGSNNGPGVSASFKFPSGIATDLAGNLYVSDSCNNLIRKIDPTGIVSTLAGTGFTGSTNGNGTASSFSQPAGVATDALGNVYVADEYNSQIRKIDPAGNVSTLAGSGSSGYSDGKGLAASFNKPSAVTVDGLGNVYVADSYNNYIRKIDPTGVVTTVAGGGPNYNYYNYGPDPTIYLPFGITTDLAGNIYVGDTNNHSIRKIPTTGFTISSSLPIGLTFEPTTGIISGTPTSLIPITDYTIKAYNIEGSSLAKLSLGVTQFDLPTTNYHITITGESCIGVNNSTININADLNLNYSAVLTGNGINTTQKFNYGTKFTNLPVGTYNLCFTVDGQSTYNKCFTVTVTQPSPLSVFATVNDMKGNIELNLNGGSVYYIQLNNKIYTTTESSFTVPLAQGNNALQVTTDKECQGVFTKLINPSFNISPYPMPFENTLNLNLGGTNLSTVSVKIYSANTGLQVFNADYQNQSGVLQLDLSKLAKGAYGLKLIINNTQKEFKIIK